MFLSIVNFLFSTLVVHATPVADFPQFIPLAPIRPPASDLYYNNKILFPDEARTLRESGIDLSTIDPDPTSDWWSPDPAPPRKEIAVQNGDTVRYAELVDTPVKIFRFNVYRRESDGTEKTYTVLVGKRVQTFLLRKALLEKLGYRVPAMKRLSKLTVQFKTAVEKEYFVEDKTTGLRWQADGAEEWITNLSDKNSSNLVFQDIIVFNDSDNDGIKVKEGDSDSITNLAMGYIRPDFTKDRRVINALIVPYNLIDVRESINGFRWHSASIRSNAIYLPLEDDEQFTTPIEDARWIARRIQKLTRRDYEDIVKAAEYPEAPAKLLVEKLIARRNTLLKLLEIKDQPMAYNPMITFGSELKNGELTKGDYDGFGARLAMGEEESPISPKEIKDLFKMKGISTAIGELIARVNADLVPKLIGQPDIQGRGARVNREAFLKELFNAIKTGEPFDIGFDTWTEKIWGANVIASREVVSGSYLGTDNRIQLVDTFGVSAHVGLYIGTVGLKAGQFLDGNTMAYYTRQYSHLRPLTSIHAAIEEPYKNILVPLIKQEIGGIIPGDLQEDFATLSQDEQVQKAQKIAQIFKDELGDGESIIISDTIGGMASARFGIGLTDHLTAMAQLKGNMLHLSRLHILRAGDTLHVYKDRGNLRSLELVVSMKAEIEVLNIRASFSKGTASTDFYKLDISNDLNENPDLLLNLSALRQIFLDNKLNRIKAISKPHVLEHKFTEKQGELDFLFWNYFNLKTTDRIKVLRATEEKPEYFVRHFAGERTGTDYQSLTVDILNYLLQEATGEAIAISNSTSGDPGDTLFGKSNSRYSYFEAEIDPTSKPEKFGEQFVGVVYRWRGWTSKREEMKKRVADFSNRYGFQFYDQNAFNLIDKAELYTLALRIFVYQKGINYILRLPEKTMEEIFIKNSELEYYPAFTPTGSHIKRTSPREQAMKSYKYFRKDYDKQVKKGQMENAAITLTKLVSLLEASLNKNGLLLAVGGEKNILITSDLQGFLKGEDGSYAKLPVEGNQIGQVASLKTAGPLSSLQSELGMTESEFFINWLLRKL